MNDVVWSVNILIGIGLVSVLYFLFYILILDENEEKNSSNSHHSETFDE
jgi:phosphotransferase system  glucose/maltose/N-acetylglucosamine-specific IIC component